MTKDGLYGARRGRRFVATRPDAAAVRPPDALEMALRVRARAGQAVTGFRVVIPTWGQTLGTLVACLDAALPRHWGGVPTYVLTDNVKTLTVEHVAGSAVRHPQLVTAARHYGATVISCVPYAPESKGGVEATVKIAERDLVQTKANLLGDYASFTELVVACTEFCDRVNSRCIGRPAAPCRHAR